MNRRKLSGAPSHFAMVGRGNALPDSDEVQAEKRARLMIVAKAQLHFTDEIAPGHFVMVDPATMDDEARAEAAESGVTTRTLFLRAQDLDKAIKQYQVN